MLEQDIIKKRRIDENKITELTELDIGDNNREYKVEAICNSIVNIKKSELSQLLSFTIQFFKKII